MKQIHYFFIAVVSICFLSCADDLNINQNMQAGILRMTETTVNGDSIEQNIELIYDADSTLIGINTMQDDFSNVNYSVEYANDSIVSLTITQIFNTTNTETTTIYDVVFDSIIINLVTNDTLQFALATSDDFVNGYREYFGPQNTLFNEVIFARGIDDNIVSMTESTTGIDGQLIQTFEFTYSNYAQQAMLNSAYNPIINTNSSYDPFIGTLFNLRISEQPPLTSSQLDANGNFIENAIEGTVTTNLNQQVTDLSYKVADLPLNCFRVEYTYD